MPLAPSCPTSDLARQITAFTNTWNSGLVVGALCQSGNQQPPFALYLYTLFIIALTINVMTHTVLRINPSREILFDMLMTALNTYLSTNALSKEAMELHKYLTFITALCLTIRLIQLRRPQETEEENEEHFLHLAAP